MKSNNETSNGESLQEPIADVDFFYETVFVQVSSRLFCIPKEYLNVPETVFAQMFIDGSPADSVYGPEGSHQKCPIKLEGIDPLTFRGFLKTIWKREQVSSLSTDEWVNILRLATMWNFSKVVQEADAKVFSALKDNASELLKLGKEFRKKDWVVRGLCILVNPSSLFSGKVVARLGYQDKQMEFISIREALHYYSMEGLTPDYDSHSSSVHRCLACPSCRDGPPPCNRKSRYASHNIICDGQGIVTWCKCGETIFAHRGTSMPADRVVEALVKEVFKDELKLLS